MTNDKLIDLHVHSCYSDGLHTPEELVIKARNRGLKALAIADHDSVDGIDEALEAGCRYGIEIIPAVELSVEFECYRDVHLLGYLINHHDRAFRDNLGRFRTRREERGRSIIERINSMLDREGKHRISYEEVIETAGGALGRPHIARLLMSKGHVGTMQEAFIRYLEPCDVPKEYFPIHEALKEIKRLGGISVLAHPLSISEEKNTLRRIILELAGAGLDGVEAYNNMCYREDSVFFAGLAAEGGLVITGGSDYHGGEDGPDIGEIRNGLTVRYDRVIALKSLQAQCIRSKE